MKTRRLLYSITLLLLILCVFLQSCQPPSNPVVTSTSTAEIPDSEVTPEYTLPISTPTRTGQFILRYDSGSTMNPITGMNRDNLLLSSLMYESLFVLDSELNVEPLLCDSCTTDDDMTFTIGIKPDIAMSDGSFLTADDVTYTLRQVMHRGLFTNLFNSTVDSITSDGELTVTIVLFAPNCRFTSLLDVPIIKSGSIENRVPPGTGPYTFSEGEILRLLRFPQHRDYAKLPVPVIYLRECSDDELTQLFDDGEISLLWDDPSDASDIRLNRLHEKRYYETTTLQYIGFNAREGLMRDSYVRRAISCSIDRDYIADKIMLEQSIAAPLPFSRFFDRYDKQWEHRDLYPLEEMSLLLDSAYLKDVDQDSFLELTDGFGGYIEVSIDFIVNSENLHRLQAAQLIADTLRRNGLDIMVRELPWDSFQHALQTGDFDMYYGEITLGADFDLSPLLLPGKLNYGGTASTSYLPFIEDFLAAGESEEILYAIPRLLKEINLTAPFAPVVFKRYAVCSPVGAISGAEPSQSSIFRNISDWKLNLTMLA